MSEREVALVSGASSGIGAGVARRLAADGAAVVVCGRDEGRCEAVRAEIEAAGGLAWTVPFDLTDPAATRDAIERARRAAASVGPISWLVNNAGVVRTAPLLPREGESNDELFELHLALNLHGARRLIELLVPDMIESGFGRVVNVASSAALRGYPYAAAYAASKHALLGYSLVAAEELARTGVGLNVVCPHYVDTPLTIAAAERAAASANKSVKLVLRTFARANPGGRLVSIDEVAVAVTELIAGTENGRIVELDGTEMMKEVVR
ncbi:MAG: 3-hydroxyacyl-CoA dehydrogenase [Planctomycetes bacterium]|jgi:NAD(P)-dependent dehydrogenase (short-subunit alcohol dehydrogenase family)|nr:3-hydroxyacyl-CoA dehydrogenase [Planctomycetota bacterium]MDP6409734.1 SDR family oxidoreductase [Planctomycetota bacterium]